MDHSFVFLMADLLPAFNLRQGRTEMSYFTQKDATWKTIRRVVETEVLLGPLPPKAILLHLGGNDVSSCPQKRIFNNIKHEIKYLREAFPEVILVWVDILLRLCWRSGSPLDKKRKRLNGYGRTTQLYSIEFQNIDSMFNHLDIGSSVT